MGLTVKALLPPLSGEGSNDAIVIGEMAGPKRFPNEPDYRNFFMQISSSFCPLLL